MRRKFWFWLGFFLVVGVALFFRFWLLKELPGGLHPDASANGLDAWQILQGKLAVFYPRGNGREALFFYLIALFVKLFGLKPWAVYLASAVVSFLTVPLLYLLLNRWFGLRVAFLGALFLATSYWATSLSRNGFRANLIPLFTVLFLYLLTLAWQEKRRRGLFGFLAGLSLGAGFYSYIAYRILLFLLPVLWFVLWYWADSSSRKQLKSLAGWVSFGAFLALLPLLIFFARYPHWIVGRAAQVSIFNPDLNQGDLLGFFWWVLKKTLLGYVWEGDLNFRHNVSGFPFISPPLVPWFLVGAIVSLYFSFRFCLSLLKERREFLTYFLVLVFFVAFLVPEIATGEGIPHGLRLIGTLPFAYALVGIGLGAFLSALKHRWLAWTTAVAYCLLVLIFNFWAYFDFSAHQPAYFYAFRRDLTPVADYLRQHPGAYLALEEYSQQTVDFLLLDKGKIYREYRWEELKNACPRNRVVFAISTFPEEERLKLYCPSLRLIEKETNPFTGEDLMHVYGY